MISSLGKPKSENIKLPDEKTDPSLKEIKSKKEPTVHEMFNSNLDELSAFLIKNNRQADNYLICKGLSIERPKDQGLIAFLMRGGQDVILTFRNQYVYKNISADKVISIIEEDKKVKFMIL